jgi:pyruvate, water dikinase
MPARNNLSFVTDINKIDEGDRALVGDKGISLGKITKLGLAVPPGIIITTKAYSYFIKENNLEPKIKNLLDHLNPRQPEEIQEASAQIKNLILAGQIPEDLAWQIMKAYSHLGWLTNNPVAVRSSAVGEDLQTSFLNILGEANVIKKIQACWASLFNARGLFYRQERQKSLLGQGIAVIIQKMIQAKTSGILFTADPAEKQKNVFLIEAVWGLGEYLVQGKITPDQYLIDASKGKIINQKINPQKIQLIQKKGKGIKSLVPKKEVSKAKLTPNKIAHLVKMAKKIHRYYFFPQEIEWAQDKNQFFILQSRPLTTAQVIINNKTSKPIPKPPNEKDLDPKPQALLEGIAASPGYASGPVKKIKSAKEIKKITRGDILVAPAITPDFIPAMRLVAGIITNQGGQTSHAAIISRELSIPCLVGTKTATRKLKNGQIVTINGAQGKVFPGRKLKKPATTKYSKKAAANIKTATKIYVNLSDPDIATEIAQRNVDGVGLMRAEFMLAKIGVHPQALIKKGKGNLITKELANSLEKVCRAFFPRPVIYRTSDLKTNEYRHLKDGEKYEPKEENPLIGFRGSSRYLINSQIFSLELEAIKFVRNKKGLRNLWLMLPFVRTVSELIETKKIIAAQNLSRGPSFKLWLMLETPANIIRLPKFIETGIDGVSIGSNDLTMLILGIDRDNNKLAKLFNEANPAVLWAFKKAINTCQKYQITSSICGQAPLNKPNIIKKLVRWGITSLSVDPDTLNKARNLTAQAEKEVVGNG